MSRVDSAHHLHGVGEMSTSLQETGEKQVRIAWSTIQLPNGATEDADNHAGRDPMNLSPYACSGLSTRKNNRTEKKISMSHYFQFPCLIIIVVALSFDYKYDAGVD